MLDQVYLPGQANSIPLRVSFSASYMAIYSTPLRFPNGFSFPAFDLASNLAHSFLFSAFELQLKPGFQFHSIFFQSAFLNYIFLPGFHFQFPIAILACTKFRISSIRNFKLSFDFEHFDSSSKFRIFFGFLIFDFDFEISIFWVSNFEFRFRLIGITKFFEFRTPISLIAFS